MTWEAWLTCVTAAALFFAIVRNVAPIDFLMVAAVTVLVAAGEVFHSPRLPSASEAVAGLGNRDWETQGW